MWLVRVTNCTGGVWYGRRYCIVDNFGEHGSHLVLVEFKLGDLNAQCHRCTYVKFPLLTFLLSYIQNYTCLSVHYGRSAETI